MGQHRFLDTFDRVLQTGGKRIWALDGMTEDVYYLDAWYGCLTLRHSLEAWARRHDFVAVAVLTGAGELEFTGSADPAAAQQLFQSSGETRRPKYGKNFSGGAENRAAAEPPEAPENTAQAAGGMAQRMKNIFSRISPFVARRRPDNERVMLIVEDITYLLTQAANGDELVQNELRRTILTDWCVNVSSSAILVFASSTAYQNGQTGLFDDKHGTSRNGALTVAAPEAAEVGQALLRLSAREDFLIRDLREIATWQVGRGGDLRSALDSVISVVARHRNGGKTRPLLALGDFLNLPELDRDAIARVRGKLDALVGLSEVKGVLKRLELTVERDRKMLLAGQTPPAETRHMLFLGNPGTGKTEVARLVGQYLKALGLLSGGQLVETGFGELKSEYAGETGSRFRRMLEQARGGVLFFDEIHQLGEAADTAPAREIKDMLVPALENYRHEMVFIGAGYSSRIAGFWRLDPGMDSRFPPQYRFLFKDYSVSELWEIFRRQTRDLACADGVEARIRSILSARSHRAHSGNARAVRMLVEAVRSKLELGEQTIQLIHLPPLLERREEDIALAQQELERMVGLSAPRRMIQTVMDNLEYDMEFNAAADGGVNTHPGNMVFVGPPGTGKSTMAQIMARYLYGLGVTERPDALVVTAKDLIGEYVGQTAPKVGDAFARAQGGILFIDEAYALADNQEFGRQAVTALVGEITLPANASVILILAGYPGNMGRLFRLNDGLERRIGHTIVFENFQPRDCAELARRAIAARNYTVEDGFFPALEQLAADAIRTRRESFGNAGWVLGVVEAALSRMKARVIRARKNDEEVDPRRLLTDDLKQG